MLCFKKKLTLTQGQAMILSFYHNFYNRAISTFSQHPVDHIPKLYKPYKYLHNEHCWKDAAEKQKLHQYWIRNGFKMYEPEVCHVVITCLTTCMPAARILLSPKPDCNQLLKQNIKYLSNRRPCSSLVRDKIEGKKYCQFYK